MLPSNHITSRIKHVITFDFETFYDPADRYSLSRKDITAEEYINDERFEVILVSIKIDDGDTYVLWNDDPEAFAQQLQALPWDSSCAIAFNGGFFDFLILGWKYGIFPFFYLDPLMMARPISPPAARNSLAALCDRFGLPPKGDAVHNMAGIHLADMTPQMREEYADYCIGDTDRCLEIALILLEYWTLPALAWMCIACRMSARLTLVIDKNVVEQGLAEEAANAENRMQLLADALMEKKWRPPYVEKGRKGQKVRQYLSLKECLTKDSLFLDILETLGIEEPPMKWSEKQKKEVPALAKTDPIMREAIEVGNPSPELQIALEARLGAKSTITAGRLERHLGIGNRLQFLPAFINPFGAHTGRNSGCLVADTEILCLDENGVVAPKKITEVLLSDRVWDGEEFVSHEGVVFSGYRDVISYKGLTGTPDHVVFTDCGEISLGEAKTRGADLVSAPYVGAERNKANSACKEK